MDPDACLQEFFEKCAEGDYDYAKNCLDNLHIWLSGDGFVPQAFGNMSKTDAAQAVNRLYMWMEV